MMLFDIEFTFGKELKAKSMDLSEWLGWNQGKCMMEEPKPSGLILRSSKTPSSLNPLFLKADTFMVMLLSFPWPLRRQHSRAVLSAPYPNRACLHQKDELPLISLQKVPLTAPVICYEVVVGFWSTGENVAVSSGMTVFCGLRLSMTSRWVVVHAWSPVAAWLRSADCTRTVPRIKPYLG